MNLIKQLKYDKIEMNWNKNPIEMDLFLSFLNIDIERNVKCAGSDMGWTELLNADLKLRINGGRVGGVEYLDRIQLGKNLQNEFNNYVNPFYLWEHLTVDGKKFFLEYYKPELKQIMVAKKSEIEAAKVKLVRVNEEMKELKEQLSKLRMVELV